MSTEAKADPVRALADYLATKTPYRALNRDAQLRVAGEYMEAALAQQAGAEPFAYLQSADLVGIEASKKLHSGAVFTAATKASSSFDLPLYITPQPAIPSADRQAIRMLVAAGYVTEAKANEALQLAHGFTTGDLESAR